MSYVEFVLAHKKQRTLVAVLLLAVPVMALTPGVITHAQGAIKAHLSAKEAEQQNQARQVEIAAIKKTKSTAQAADIAGWKEQFAEYSAIKGVKLELTAFSESPYSGSVKIEANLQCQGTDQCAEALTFLQVFGFLESFSAGKAVVHANIPT